MYTGRVILGLYDHTIPCGGMGHEQPNVASRTFGSANIRTFGLGTLYRLTPAPVSFGVGAGLELGSVGAGLELGSALGQSGAAERRSRSSYPI